MAVFNWEAWVDRSTVLTTQLDGLADGAYSAVGTEIDNSANLDTHGVLEVNLASLNPTAGAFIQLFLVQTVDETNYEDAPSSTNPGYHMALPPMSVTTGSTAKRIISKPFEIPPGRFKFVLYNDTNVALAANSNTVELWTSSLQSV